MEESLNDIHKLKSSACALGEGNDKNRKIGMINDAITRLGNYLRVQKYLLKLKPDGLSMEKSQTNMLLLVKCYEKNG